MESAGRAADEVGEPLPRPGAVRVTSGARHVVAARTGPVALRVRPFASEAVIALLVTLLAARFTISHLGSTLVHPPASLAKLCQGTGEIPFQYRALVPWVVDLVHRVVPPISWTDSRTVIAGVVEAASVAGLYYALRALVRPVVGTRARASLAALALFHVLPYHYVFPENWPFWYPSDLPSVLFFTLGLVCLQRGSWLLFYPLLAVATFNRETTFFLSIAFVLTRLGRMPLHKVALHAAAQGSIWAAVKLLLDRLYGANPGVGGYYGNALTENLEMLASSR
jgi:hypothetical protein